MVKMKWNVSILAADTNKSPAIAIVDAPASLHYKARKDVHRGLCCSVCYMPSGDILLGSTQGITRLNSGLEFIKFSDMYRGVTDIVSYHHSLYVLHKRKGSKRVSQVSSDLSNGFTLFDISTLNYVDKLSVSKRYIVMTDKCNNRLIAYDKSTETLKDLTVPQAKSHEDVCFISDIS